MPSLSLLGSSANVFGAVISGPSRASWMLALSSFTRWNGLSERLADGREAKRRVGGHIGGDAPFGFRKVGMGRAARLEPVPEQQQALARMQALRSEGKSLRAIAAELAAQGHRISHVAVKAALAREARQ
jgi:DNA invertase Pin-like site-specific DNA recombinase